jgi:serine/threonine protein kinase
MAPKRSQSAPEVFDHGPQWTDISISDIPKLPTFPKTATTSNPRFLARSHHSQVYLLDLMLDGVLSTVVLKIFSKELKRRYTNETNAYRFLNYYNIPSEGVVPKIHGVLPTVNQKLLNSLLQDAIPDDVTFKLPASAVVMEYIEGGETPTKTNMTPELAKEALRGLELIHGAHVLHGDGMPRNILIFPDTGKAVWIDFSSAEINRDIKAAILERNPVKQLLYYGLVLALDFEG